MNPLRLLPACFLILAALTTQAQSNQITDEELKKYVITMDSVEDMQQNLRNLVAERVQSNTVMPVARYNELFKIQDDSTKLEAANATAEEIAFLNEITELRKTTIESINTTYQDMARNYVGVKAFTKIRKSLQTDQQLKARYDAMAKDIDSKENGG